ncbi:hypothetical protein BT69DRAFT_1276218 [Atractiella rhizophila]|nr:hypothetical protein BT69DRAFT_1276218 [Atractiella rhizophila]
MRQRLSYTNYLSSSRSTGRNLKVQVVKLLRLGYLYNIHVGHSIQTPDPNRSIKGLFP